MSENHTVHTFGIPEPDVMEQMQDCLNKEEGARGVLCADNHLGYGQPVGAAVAYHGLVSVTGVGYDIGCGNKAVKTGLLAGEVDVAGVMDEIERRISFGIGRNEGETADHAVLDLIRDAEFEPQRKMLDSAANQLGTVGGGNHYVDLFEADDGYLWIGVHFGSRGFGHRTATGFMWMKAGQDFFTKGQPKEKELGIVTWPSGSAEGQAYRAAMELAGAYAYAGRDVVVNRVLEILGTEAIFEVHNHHNYAWEEEHFGERWTVVRKGCTPAWPGQRGFVGSTMGEESVILEGLESETSELALYSTVHGAGRVMSRSKAAGSKKWRRCCCNRDCDWIQPPKTHPPEDGHCPKCGHPKLAKRPVAMSGGVVDWEAAKESVANAGVELRGGAADEAPEAYKRLNAVLELQGPTIQVLHRLRPIGVAMAPAEQRYIELPEDFRPSPEWRYSSLEVLADVAPYTGASGEDVRWCHFERVAAGDASVYPVKASVPDRGQGQWKFSEVRQWRAERAVLEGLYELHRDTGTDLPPGIDADWLRRAIDQGGS